MEKSHVAAQGPFLSPSEPRADIANGATLESLAATTKGSTACAVAECRADPGGTGQGMGKAPFRAHSRGCVPRLQPSRLTPALYNGTCVHLAHIFNPRKWQSGFKPGFLQFGEPYLPGHHPCPCLSFSTCPQRNAPNPSVPIPLQTMCPPQGRRWPSAQLAGCV